MQQIGLEFVFVLFLLILNGVFAMAEIAIVSSRKARLKALADDGDSSAKAALKLAESPNQFLATVQIGITLVGILAGAFGGATIAEAIAQSLGSIPALARYADSIALGIVVIVITFLSLVLGELVPKRIGLGNPEGIAMRVAKPMRLLSTVSSPVVKLLSVSTELLLRILRFKASEQSSVTEDEVKVMMQEGLNSGAFNEVESEIVRSALDLDQWTVKDIMTPRVKITWLNVDEPHEHIWHKIVVSGHSFFPVYKGRRDHVVGIVSVKAMYANLAGGVPARIPDLMTDPLIVPATLGVLPMLETYRKTGKHIALIADEFGGIEGLVTLNDVMQAILGEFPSIEERSKPVCKRRDDGSWLVDGILDIDTLESLVPDLSFRQEDTSDYTTLAGFLMKRLGRVPAEGENLVFGGFTFEVIDMDRHRVDKVLIAKAPAEETELSAGA